MAYVKYYSRRQFLLTPHEVVLGWDEVCMNTKRERKTDIFVTDTEFSYSLYCNDVTQKQVTEKSVVHFTGKIKLKPINRDRLLLMSGGCSSDRLPNYHCMLQSGLLMNCSSTH